MSPSFVQFSHFPLCLYSVCSPLLVTGLSVLPLRVMISGLFCQLSQFRSFLRSVLAILGSVCSLTFGIKPTHSNATFLLLGSSLIKSTHLLLTHCHSTIETQIFSCCFQQIMLSSYDSKTSLQDVQILGL